MNRPDLAPGETAVATGPPVLGGGPPPGTISAMRRMSPRPRRSQARTMRSKPGYGPLSTGVHLLPVALSVGAESFAGTQLAVRAGTKLIVTIGLVAMAAFTGLPDNACQARLGRGHGCHLGPPSPRPRLHAPRRHAAWWVVQTLRGPHDRLSIRESVTEPAPEVQLEIAGSGGHR